MSFSLLNETDKLPIDHMKLNLDEMRLEISAMWSTSDFDRIIPTYLNAKPGHRSNPDLANNFFWGIDYA